MGKFKPVIAIHGLHLSVNLWKDIISGVKLKFIATDKRGYPHNIFFYICMKTYVVGTHEKRLLELKSFFLVFLANTINIFIWCNENI